MTDQALPPKRHGTPAETLRMARNHLGRTGLVFGLLAVIALGFAPFGVHEEMFDLDYAVGVVALGWAPVLAWLALILGVLAVVMVLVFAPRRGFVVPLLGVVFGALCLAVIGHVRTLVAANPPIHDVATDWTEPLMFGPSVSAARGADANATPADPRVGILRFSTEMEGQRVAEINARTCPGAVPAVVIGNVQTAYDKALDAVKREGLTVVTENPASGRIEATAVTRWMKLKGDVVVRVRPEGAGARVDFRSVSRTGEVDLGENCRRVSRLRTAVLS